MRRLIFGTYTGLCLAWLLVGLASALVAQFPEIGLHLSGLDDGLRFALLSQTEPEVGAQAFLDYLFSGLNLVLGLVLFRLRHHGRAASYLAYAMVGTAAAFNLTAHRTYQVVQLWLGIDIDIWHILLFHGIAGTAYANALIAFPHGHILRTRRWLTLTTVVTGNLFLLFFALQTGTDHILTFLIFYGVATPLIGLAAQRIKYRRAVDEESRQQSRVMMWTLLLTVAVAYAVTGLTIAAGMSGLYGLTAESTVHTIFRLCRTLFTIIPVALIIGVLRLRLWEAEKLINRTLVYGFLVTLISAVYVAVVMVGAGPLGEPGTLLYLIATAVLATLFGPLRDRAQRLANWLLYGGLRSGRQRSLADLSQRLTDAVEVHEVLPEIATAVAMTLPAEQVTVHMRLSDGHHQHHQVGMSESPHLHFATVTHNDVALGEIEVRTTWSLTAAQQRMLRHLAEQAAVGLRNARLAAELETRLDELTVQAWHLQASHDRLAAAGAQERRRLERDLHDGAQQLLVALRVHLSLFDRQRGTEAAGATFHRMTEMASAALEQIQAIAAGLAPRALAEGGLAQALAQQSGPLTTVHADARLTTARPAAPIESTAYFACVEAMQNAAKHAPGSRVAVRIELRDDELHFEVADDGPGFDPAQRWHGNGLTNMADRIAAIGGNLTVSSTPQGTKVKGRIPAPRTEAAAGTQG